MSARLPPNFCPYIGLQPYSESDAAFFFGRDRDQRVIVSNLYASPLTILYGASGVGKSSILLAGVLPRLRATPRTAVAVFRTWQDASFCDALKTEIVRAIQVAQNKPLELDHALAFDEFLSAALAAFGGTIILIFDQFEEYFLYHPASLAEDSFDAEFARTVNRQDIDVPFLLALREDGLSKLDRFRARIPNLLGNTLRLRHLDPSAAEEAIRKPLEVYNKRAPDHPVGIEAALVQQVIEQVRTGQVSLTGASGAGHSQTTSDQTAQIETPFLQMVMTHLWEAEQQEHSSQLRLATFTKLGGAQTIVRTHLDQLMDNLSATEKEICSTFFDRLVTPSGAKVAQFADDLVKWTNYPPAQVSATLKTLADARVLRPVSPPVDQPQMTRYEIFHDVLAPAVLDWRRRYMEQQAQEIELRREQAHRRRVIRNVGSAIATILLAAFTVLADFLITFLVRKVSMEL